VAGAWVAWLVAVFAAGADATPVVVQTTPVPEAVGVGRGASITVRFDSALDPATVVPANVLVTSSLQGTRPVSVTWDAPTLRILVDPLQNFLPGERVTVTLGSGITDALGTPLAHGWHFEFSTWTAAMPDGGFTTSGPASTIGSIAFNATVGDLTADGLPEIIFSNAVPDSLTIVTPLGGGAFSVLATIGRPPATLPRHVPMGDVDGDGLPDLVVCASGPNRVDVIRNLGGGAFAPAVQYATGQTPYGAYLGDLDADGDLDVATANFNGHSVSVLENVGGGVLGAAVHYPAGAGADSPRWVDGADLDEDGDVDLVCCNGYSFDVSVFLNDGDGSFAVQPTLYPVDDGPQFCELRDFTGDGLPDLVTVNSTGESVSLLGGNGDGTFAPAVHTPVQGQFPYGLHVVDLDGDRDLDLVLPIRGVSAWQPVWNDGAGGLTAGELYFGGNHCHTIGAADWDGDGDIDVVAGYAISKNMYFYPQSVAPLLVGTLPGWNASGLPVDTDVELTFNVDLSPGSLVPSAYAVHGAQSGLHAVDVTWSAVDRRVTLSPQQPFAAGEIVTAVVRAGAVSSVAGLPCPGGVVQFMTSGEIATGALGTPAAIPVVPVDPVDLVACELDGDGRIDLAVAGYLSGDVSVLLSGETGVPALSSTISAGEGTTALFPADLDGDGDLDLAAANAGGSSLVPLYNQAGTLTPGEEVPVGGAPYAITGGDFDRDGDVDLAVGLLSPAAVRILRNDGGGPPVPAELLDTGGVPPTDVAAADVDRDGTPDVVAVLAGADEIRVYRALPGSGFAAADAHPAPGTPVGVFPWDADGDAWVDLAVSSYGAGTVSLLSGLPGAGFSAPVTLMNGTLPRGPWGADLNGDGALDLVTAISGSGRVTVLSNDGAGAFAPSATCQIGLTPYAAATGDFDADGRVDFAFIDRVGGALSVLLASPGVTGVGLAEGAPTGLLRAWPNPFVERLTVELGLPAGPTPVVLDVFDLAGRVVRHVHDGPLGAGRHEIGWDGRDRDGRRVATGVYFLRLEAAQGSWTRKVARVR
jgi:hypothetical protein